jgi:hypothetical protein
MANTKLDARQSVLRAALSMAGSSANDSLDTIFPKIDAELAKHFEDRNILLTDGGTITFTGTQLQFTENLNIVLNQKISGAAPQIISLGSANVNFSATGQMWYAVIDRTAGTAVSTTGATSLPSATSPNQEVFLIAKRVDAGDGTQRVYWRNGMALNAGQSVRLGASGSGSGGSGTGDDLDALPYRASFADAFTEASTNANSSIVTSGTNATFNAAKSMYVLSYDAGKTVTTVGTAATLSATPAYTVAVGDILNAGGYARKITAVASQTSYTLESAFPANVTAIQATVSQAVYTKDIYNFAVDGSALSAGFGTSTFSDILVDYKDAAASGSNIFVPNVAALLAYDATNDNVNYTAVNKRVTNETDTASNTLLPSAGTSLYLRFFSNATTGSGTSNLITYKAFLQKTVVFSGGGVANAAYAFTNNVGTPVNMTIGSSGGKTTATLNFSYAMGFLPGTASSTIKVYLNGQKLPRFINSTLTPDSSFTETSPTVITLDRDYSGLNLSLEVVQDVALADSSSTNTTNITQAQTTLTSAFQGFIDQSKVRTATTVVGTPAAGTFYSSVTNRANIIDISQDLKPSFGIERFPVQALVQLQNEFGPNGEIVWAAANDDRGLIRCIGAGWTTVTNAFLGAFFGTNTVGDYLEFTFYGTGFNALMAFDAQARNYQWSVDGGTVTSVTVGTGYTALLTSRNYATNQVINIASGLALGVHTVRIICNTASVGNGSYFNGFEILNTASTTSLNVNSGTSYANGKTMALASASAIGYNSAFESGTLAARGGHVVVYQKSDGTIGKAVTPANSASAFLASADHTNEEVVRVYNFREFAAGRTDDFSPVTTTTVNASFTLDDGSTTLMGSSVNAGPFAGADGLGLATSTSFATLIFVGTGIDVIISTGNTTAGTFNIVVDGTTVGTLSLTIPGSGTVTKQYKLASGLPYGSHTCKIISVGATPAAFTINKHVVYQPKKPAIPSGAVELADYNAMATYVADAVNGNFDTISTGVLHKQSVREMIYAGTWTISPSTTTIGGYFASTTAAGAYVEYTFFGTGLDIVAPGDAGASTTVQIDGVNYTGAATALGTSSSWTPGTSTWVPATVNGGKLQITGLTLGIHKVRITNVTAGKTYYNHAIQVITPIYSARSTAGYDGQNTLPIGSSALSDNRKATAIKDVPAQKKNVSQAFGITSSPSTTSLSFIPLQDMSLTHVNTSGRIKISYTAQAANGTSGQDEYFTIFIDGVQANGQKVVDSSNAYGIASDVFMAFVSPGIHKIDIYWKVSAGTGTSISTYRNLLVEEV